VETATKAPEQHQKASVSIHAVATAQSSVAGITETVCMCMVNFFGIPLIMRRQS